MSKRTALRRLALGPMLLCLLTCLALCGVVPQALLLRVEFFDDFLAAGLVPQQRLMDKWVSQVWWLVGPLAFVNLCWVAYAVFRWRRRSPAELPPMPEDMGKMFEASPAPSRGEASPHVQPDASALKDSP